MKVEYTHTFNKTLHRAVDFLTSCMDVGEEKVVGYTIEVIESFEERMADQPLSCQTCKQAEELGVFGFHEYHNHDYRIIYSIAENRVMALLFLHQRQSIEKALTDHCLAF